jgi:hypothetical protein
MSSDQTPPPSSTAVPAPGQKLPLKQRLSALMEEYGQIAIVTWFVIFGLTIGGFAVAIKLGYQPESASGQTGVLAAAYVATQLTKPLRALATLAITPVAARLVRRPAPETAE